MTGRSEYQVPDAGRDHVVVLDGTEVLVRPRFDQTMFVEAYFEEQGLSPSDELKREDLAAIYERCLAFLPADARPLFEALRPEQQRLVCSKLYRIHLEISDGMARPNPGEDRPPLEQAREAVQQLREALTHAEARLAEAEAEAAVPGVPPATVPSRSPR